MILMMLVLSPEAGGIEIIGGETIFIVNLTTTYYAP